jgi:hypothetical protein
MDASQAITLTADQASALAARATTLSRRPGGCGISLSFIAAGPAGPGLYCWPEAAPGLRTPLFAKELAHERDFDPARMPPRNQDGSVFHPDMDGIGDEEFPMQPQLRAIGWDCTALSLVDDDAADPARREQYHDESEGNFSFWTPLPPDPSWSLAAMYDTEDGPVALYVRRAD